jgi:hypothetical protein
MENYKLVEFTITPLGSSTSAKQTAHAGIHINIAAYNYERK